MKRAPLRTIAAVAGAAVVALIGLGVGLSASSEPRSFAFPVDQTVTLADGSSAVLSGTLNIDAAVPVPDPVTTTVTSTVTVTEPPPTTTAPPPTTTEPPVGTAPWRGSFNASYQAAQPGATIVVPAGAYGRQTVAYRGSLANLSAGCSVADTSKCVRFVMAGPVTIDGPLEIRGSSVWIRGGGQLRVNGYIDTEADSVAQHPDHVIVEGTSSPSFGIFNVDTATFRNMDVGPSTVTTGCAVREGAGIENKIGWAGGITYVPREITIDGLRIHNQNGDSGRIQSDCHWGGLFLVTVDGLTIRNTVFERNVVYHVQIQNFGGAPAAKRVVFDRDSFSCPVNWLYQGAGCDGQRAIQFDYDPGTEFTLINNAAANGASGLYGCYVGSCGGLVGVGDVNNTNLPASTTAPPVP